MEFRSFRLAIGILTGILMFGTLGYYVIEHMTLFDAFYMTIITISTVGFSEITFLAGWENENKKFLMPNRVSLRHARICRRTREKSYWEG